MTTNKAEHKWLAGNGAMCELIRTTDWAATPLGPLETWPLNLKTTVSLCLASNFPINIIWGPEATQIYNAGYRVVCGDAHPRAIGESYRVTWESAWSAIGEPFEMASAGQTSYLENQRMFLNRNGYLEETFFTFSLSPILDESGKVAGLFHPVTETTSTMLQGRRLRALADLASRACNADSAGAACELIIDTLAQYQHDVPLLMIYQYDAVGSRVTRLGATIATAAEADRPDPVPLDMAVWPFRQVLDQGCMFIADVISRIGNIASGHYPEPIAKACIIPIAPVFGAPPFGFAVIGLSTRLPADAAYEQFLQMTGEALSKAIGNAISAQEELRKTAELAAIDKAKTEFFSNVSHEFRTPLTLMLGPLDDSLADTVEVLPPRQRERQERIRRNAVRLLKLVNTLLDFSRIQAGRVDSFYRPTNLTRLTADLASIFRSAIEQAGITFRLELHELDEPVFVDHDMWEKIVLNLLSNAYKFTHRGEIVVQLKRQGNAVCLTVRDTGSGIPPGELGNLFQRFHRIESAKGRTHEGSGIGLALISELVKLHGGTIAVDSVEDAGSAFAVTLPLGSAHLPQDRLRRNIDAAAVSPMRSAFIEETFGWSSDALQATSSAFPAAHASGPAPAAMPPAGGHILVVDDNADMRSYMVELLSPLGIVVAVADGEAAIRAIGRHQPKLVISDVMMPVLDGLGLLKWLRSDPGTAAIPLILLSAKAAEESRIEGLALGADDFLAKPFSAKELLARASNQIKLGEARRQTEIERSRLHEFFMRAPVPMVILMGAEHRFFLANDPYKKLIGRRVAGKTVADILSPGEAAVFIPLLDRVYNEGMPFSGSQLAFPLPDENGELHVGYLDVSYQPYRDASGDIKGILAIVIDATERVKARRIIEQAVADLTDERELRERFVTMLSHDLRTPLSVAHMGGVLLQTGAHAPDKVKAIAERIVRNASRVDAMIGELLDANRLRASELMPSSAISCQLDELLIIIGDELTELHGDRFRLVNDAGKLPGQWDANMIRRLLENLAGNAIKYGGATTPVTLGLSLVGEDMEISVHNQGFPIPPSEQEQIFQPFYRAGPSAPGREAGWGVGLPLVKALAEAHGGRVRLHSDAQRGTTFYVRLPIVGKEPAQPGLAS